MPGILDIPVEVVGDILGSLDNVRSIKSAVLANRHFNGSFKETPGIVRRVFRNQIDPIILPMALAVFDAERLPHPRTAGQVTQLLDPVYKTPEVLLARAGQLTFPEMAIIAHLHEVIEKYANEYLNLAWSRISRRDIVISRGEFIRASLAFYRVELFFMLFSRVHNGVALDAWDLFMHRHPAWENEQMCCIHDFLDQKLNECTCPLLVTPL